MTTNEPAEPAHKSRADLAAERVTTLVKTAFEGGTSQNILMALVGLLVVEVANLSDAINGVESELGRVADAARDVALHGVGQAK